MSNLEAERQRLEKENVDQEVGNLHFAGQRIRLEDLFKFSGVTRGVRCNVGGRAPTVRAVSIRLTY